MVALRIGSAYAKDRSRFSEQIRQYEKKITKTVDLFSRIKSTEQAEELTTVLYASRQLKQSSTSEAMEEQEVYNYILDWKKSWNSAEKKDAVASAIRNLVVLGWMRARISDSLTETL
jgi:predicted CopG family antitoxin